jgi:hypothetical protein
MEINITKPVKVQAKTFKLHIKCCDMFEGDLVDQDQILKILLMKVMNNGK